MMAMMTMTMTTMEDGRWTNGDDDDDDDDDSDGRWTMDDGR